MKQLVGVVFFSMIAGTVMAQAGGPAGGAGASGGAGGTASATAGVVAAVGAGVVGIAAATSNAKTSVTH